MFTLKRVLEYSIIYKLTIPHALHQHYKKKRRKKSPQRKAGISFWGFLCFWGPCTNNRLMNGCLFFVWPMWAKNNCIMLNCSCLRSHKSQLLNFTKILFIRYYEAAWPWFHFGVSAFDSCFCSRFTVFFFFLLRNWSKSIRNWDFLVCNQRKNNLCCNLSKNFWRITKSVSRSLKKANILGILSARQIRKW